MILEYVVMVIIDIIEFCFLIFEIQYLFLVMKNI